MRPTKAGTSANGMALWWPRVRSGRLGNSLSRCPRQRKGFSPKEWPRTLARSHTRSQRPRRRFAVAGRVCLLQKQVSCRGRQRTIEEGIAEVLSAGRDRSSLLELSRIVRATVPRTVFPEVPHERYMAHLAECDLFLCPFPYGNMNSIIDSFQLGLPGICLDGICRRSVLCAHRASGRACRQVGRRICRRGGEADRRRGLACALRRDRPQRRSRRGIFRRRTCAVRGGARKADLAGGLIQTFE